MPPYSEGLTIELPLLPALPASCLYPLVSVRKKYPPRVRSGKEPALHDSWISHLSGFRTPELVQEISRSSFPLTAPLCPYGC